MLNHLILMGRLLTCLADIDEQAQSRYRRIVHQMVENEGVSEGLKRQPRCAWIKAMNSIGNRAEEIIKSELINAQQILSPRKSPVEWID